MTMATTMASPTASSPTATPPRKILVVAADGAAPRSLLLGDGLAGCAVPSSGIRRSLKLKSYDVWGNRCHVGGAKVSVSLEPADGGSAASYEPSVLDGNDGSYEVSYLARPGEWKLTVQLNGGSVPPTPATVRFVQDQAELDALRRREEEEVVRRQAAREAEERASAEKAAAFARAAEEEARRLIEERLVRAAQKMDERARDRERMEEKRQLEEDEKRKRVMLLLKREEETRRRAEAALKAVVVEKAAQAEETRRRSLSKRTGGGFVVNYRTDGP